MTGVELIPAQLLKRKAVVYVRQFGFSMTRSIPLLIGFTHS